MSLTAEEVRRRIAETRSSLDLLAAAGPEHAHKAITAAAIRKQVGERFPESRKAKAVSAEFREQGPWTQALVGAGNAAIRAYLGGKSLFTDLSPEDQQKLRDIEAMKSGPESAGRLAGAVGMMAVPGSQAYRGAQVLTRSIPVARTVAPLAAESAVAGGIEALDAPLEGRDYGTEAAKAAVLNMGLGAGMAGARRVVAPQGFPKSQAALREEASLREVGIEPRLPLAIAAEPTGPVGRGLQWFHRQPLRSLPGLGAALRRQTDIESLGDWQESLLLRALPERGRGSVDMPSARQGAEAPIEDTFKDIDAWYKGQYKDLLGDQQFVVTTGPGAERVTAAYADLPGEAQNEVVQYIADLIARKTNDFGGLTGDAISDIKKTLRRRAGSPVIDSDVQIGLRNTIEALDDVVEDTLRVNSPEAAVRYAELRPAYRNLVTLEKAASRGEGRAYGEFTPDDLLSATVSKGKKEMGERAVAQGRTPLKGEAQRMRKLMSPLPKKQQESNIFQLNALLGIGGLGAAPVIEPVIGGAITGSVLGSVARPVQKHLMSEYPHQRALLSALRRRPVQEVVRGSRLATTGYLSED